jgi:hypothetical protein
MENIQRHLPTRPSSLGGLKTQSLLRFGGRAPPSANSLCGSYSKTEYGLPTDWQVGIGTTPHLPSLPNNDGIFLPILHEGVDHGGSLA